MAELIIGLWSFIWGCYSFFSWMSTLSTW